MTIRVQNTGAINFGVIEDGAVTATHARFQKSGSVPVVRQLSASVNAPVGYRLRIPAGDLDVVYPQGQLTDAHMRALIDPFWDGEDIEVDLMTSATQVITDGGYTQQTYSNWGITEE